MWELASSATARRRTLSGNLVHAAVMFPPAACCLQRFRDAQREGFLQQPHCTFQMMPIVKWTESSFSASQRTALCFQFTSDTLQTFLVKPQLPVMTYQYHIMIIIRMRQLTRRLYRGKKNRHSLIVTEQAIHQLFEIYHLKSELKERKISD